MKPDPIIDVNEVAQRYSLAWNSRDPDAILSMHESNSSFEVHGRGVRAVGTEQLRVAFTGVFARYPQFRAVAHRLLIGERHWTLDWTLEFSNEGQLRCFRCIDIVELSAAGLVSRKDTFYDYPQAQAAMTGEPV